LESIEKDKEKLITNASKVLTKGDKDTIKLMFEGLEGLTEE
jgi:hypothetical protein